MLLLGPEAEIVKQKDNSRMIDVIDACLPLLSSGKSSISACILINY